MEFSYVGYAEDRRMVSGKVSAASEELARQRLGGSRYRILSLKPVQKFLPTMADVFPSLFSLKTEAIVMLSRQLALLLESGTDIVTSLELLQAPETNGSLKKALAAVISVLRDGNPL